MSNLSFATRLINQIRSKKSIVCVGLDPRLEGSSCIPKFILDEETDANAAIWRFNKEIIEETFPYAAIYKPQMAFYEKYDAIPALKQTIDFIHEKGGLVLLDAKRNDIGSTAQAYAETVFDLLQADAVTINSYLGIDGVKPFLKYIPQGKGVILLIKTSNPSSGEFQDLFSIKISDIDPQTTEITLESSHLVRNYIQMTRLMRKWGQEHESHKDTTENTEIAYSSIGGVVGATYPTQLAIIRKEAPEHFILIPGYGAQGGKAQDIVHGVNQDGFGAIVNASRSINFAYQKEPYKNRFSPAQFGLAAKEAAKDMRNAINDVLSQENKIAY